MTAPTIHVAGTGTYAAEIIEYAEAAGLRVAGLIELVDAARIGTVRHGLPVIAPSEPTDGVRSAVVGLSGDREELWARLADHGWAPATIVHPRALVSPTARVAAGAVIGPLVVIGAATRIAELALIGRGALIGHHVEIARGVVVNPGANIGGEVGVGAGAQIGMGATITPRRTIGRRAIIAAGAVVVRDVPDDRRVQGVPARTHEASPA